jgi:hypothetical protein
MPNSLSFLPENVTVELDGTELIGFANQTKIEAERNGEDSSIQYDVSGHPSMTHNP